MTAQVATTGNIAAPAPMRCGIEMRNVALRTGDDGGVLHVASLTGEFISHSATAPPVFDDPMSYTLRLRAAEVSLDAPTLTLMMRQWLRTHPASISDVTLSIRDRHVHASGKLKKGLSVPFTLDAEPSATSDGQLRLHTITLKTAGVPVKGLLDLLNLDVESLVKTPAGAALRADGDDLLLDPTALMPPPKMEGHLEAAVVRGNRVALTLRGTATPPRRPATLPSPSARNYLYFYGGSIRFGKLTMTDADMQLIDADPATPFDFFPLHYEDQLVAGYSRNTRRKGLQVFMPDYARVRRNGGILAPPRPR